MKRLALAMLLALIASCGCIARDGAVTTQAAPWLHGRTEPPMAGVVVTVSWGGAPRSSTTNAGGAWGITVSTGAHTITATAPAGYVVTRITHPVLGSATGAVLQATILSTTNMSADVVVYLARIETPTPTPQPTAILSTPTVVTPTLSPTPLVKKTPENVTSTPEPTMPMPPVTPPLPTPRPMPTRPDGGWAPWEAPAPLVNALGMEVEWRLGVYAETNDPLWLAASSKGPTWPMMLPEVTTYDILEPDGTSSVTSLRWQMFLTPRGWRLAMATVEEPYRVAVVEGDGW